MKGDYAQITYKTGVGTATEKIVADRDGSSIRVEEPRERDRLMLVEVKNKAGVTTRKAQFAVTEVVAVIEGHETIARKSTARKKP